MNIESRYENVKIENDSEKGGTHFVFEGGGDTPSEDLIRLLL